ncbi:YwbE family protein [[Clostridium] innocuum]|nr:YwbE family protein [[Clostridium] innocuum]
MEKDHFKNRTESTTILKDNKIGDMVYICEKSMQPYAKEISDLTYGEIVRILTKKDHPRGIKVEIKTPTGQKAIGRIVYKTFNDKVIIKNIRRVYD